MLHISNPKSNKIKLTRFTINSIYFLPQFYHELPLMKTQTNLPESKLNEDQGFSSIEDTLELVSNVLKLARKVFML